MSFFSLFEKLADSLQWPKQIWPVLIQPALKGKGRSAFLALSLEESKDYDFAKDSILRVYELTPEYYRLKFRKYRKFDNQSYVEYSHTLTRLHDKWLKSANVVEMDDYKELILIEQFLRGIPIEVQRYVLEKEATTLQRATVLAENYRLLQPSKGGYKSRRTPRRSPHTSPRQSPTREQKSGSGKPFSVTCYSCGEVGHIKPNCPKNDKRQPKSGAGQQPKPVTCHNVQDVMGSFEPFCFEGVVKFDGVDSPKQYNLRLMRDTGSSQSFVVRRAVPGIENCLTQDSVVVSSLGGVTTVPRAKLNLSCGLFNGDAIVGVVDSLPVPEVDFLIANDVAGSLVVPDPIVVPVSLTDSHSVETEVDSDVFPSCVLERSKGLCDKFSPFMTGESTVVGAKFDSSEDGTRSVVEEDQVREGKSASFGTDLLDSLSILFDNSRVDHNEISLNSEIKQGIEVGEHKLCVANSVTNTPYDITIVDIKDAQSNDPSLQKLFKEALTESESAAEPTCFYLKTGILMRKYRSITTPATASWDVKHQLVVPSTLREQVMKMAHEVSSSHLGIRKTTIDVLEYFYWPGVRADIRKFCNACVICQKTGKPNQPPKPVPLTPQTVCSVPFEKIIIDCVGPLPRTKKMNQYLVTIMCSSIRYPDAFPVRNIRAKTLIPHLIKIFTQYGIP